MKPENFKSLLFSLCLLSSFNCIGQKRLESIRTSDGYIIKKNDTVFLGSGSDIHGNFIYIQNRSIFLSGDRSLTRNFVGMHGTVKSIDEYDTKRHGSKILLVVNFGGLNTNVDFDPAIANGEIRAINFHTFNNKTTSASNASAQSKADEIKKLKELLDSGALTQDEYDAEKKKILAQ